MPSNMVVEEGNLTRDPELTYLASGTALAKFGIAVNRRWQNKATQEWEEQVSFFDVACWQQLAENVGNSLSKGSSVVVIGRLDQRSWEADDGTKRSKVEIVADCVAPSLRWATVEITKNERKGGAPADDSPAHEDPFG